MVTEFALHRLCRGANTNGQQSPCSSLRWICQYTIGKDICICEYVKIDAPCNPMCCTIVIPFFVLAQELWNVDLFSGEGAINKAFSAALIGVWWAVQTNI